MRILLIYLVLTLSCFARVWHVDANSPASQGSQTGYARAVAFDSLNAAVFDSISGGDEIYIYSGTYQNAATINLPNISGDSLSYTRITGVEPGVILIPPESSGTYFTIENEPYNDEFDYVKIEGIIFYANGVSGWMAFGPYNQQVDYLKFYRCVFSSSSSSVTIYASPFNYVNPQSWDSRVVYYKCLFVYANQFLRDGFVEIDHCTIVNGRDWSTFNSNKNVKNSIIINSKNNSSLVSNWGGLKEPNHNIFGTGSGLYNPSSGMGSSSFLQAADSILVDWDGGLHTATNPYLRVGSKAVNGAENGTDCGWMQMLGIYVRYY